MKVYIISAQKNQSSSGRFTWNVYLSLEKAVEVYKRLISADTEYTYFLSEYLVIE